MDLSYLPDIFSLAAFIAGFRPLARKVGSHANLWFLGWGFLLLHHVILFLGDPGGPGTQVLHLMSLWSLEICGLMFVLASANVPRSRLGVMQIVEMGVPILVQSALSTFEVHSPGVSLVACLLFVIPAGHLALSQRKSSQAVVVLTASFAAMGLCLLPISARSPGVVTLGSLSLLFLGAAYLYLTGAERYTRGMAAVFTGLVVWGLSYPGLAIFARWHPGTHVVRSLSELPQYLLIGAIMLTLLEEHVERTERLAMHDPLTDLPNRRLFEERLIATMKEARLNRTTIACLVIDVDNFKAINDTLGHSAGDQLLRALSVRLSWHMSPRDILARTGGDEFTALLAGVTDEHHLRFIASAMMSAGSVPISIDGHSVDVHISIGIALSPDHADDIDGLRRAADEAMYTAKRRGGSMLAFAGEE